MALPLLLLLLAGHPGAPARAARGTESLAAVEVSAAQRFGWVYTALRREVAASVVPRAPSSTHREPGSPVFTAFRADDLLVQPRMNQAHEIARAARWIDALPVKVDALDGGLVFALRMRGP